MFDHIQLKVKALKSSKRFYAAALAPLGFTMEYEGDGLIGFGPKGAPALCARRPCGWVRASRADRCISHSRRRIALP